MLRRPITIAMTSIMLAVGLAACGGAEEREAKYVRRGTALFDAGDYKKARIEFKNALRINPRDAEVWYRIGLVDEAEGDLRNAFINFSRAVEQNADHILARLKLGNFYFLGEDPDQATVHAEAVLALEPGNASAHALKGALFLRRGDTDGAEREARAALAIEAGNVGAVSVLAGTYMARNDPAGALKVLDDGIRDDAKETSLFLLKARIHQDRGDAANVQQAYAQVFALKPEVREYRAALAEYLAKADYLDEAEKVLADGVGAAPDDFGMKSLLVSFLSQARGLDPAEQAIRSWLAEDRDNDQYYFALADLYVKHGATDRAVTLLQEVVDSKRLQPPGLNARVSLAQISFARGNRALADKLLAVVLEKDAQNTDALFVRARIAFDAGNFQGTIADARVILRNTPHFKPGLQLLAEALLRKGEIELAVDTLKQAVEIDPLDEGLHTRVAQLLHLRGETPLALTQLQMVTKMAPAYPVGWESLARIRIESKDWAGAENAIATLERLPEQKPVAAYLRAELLAGLGRGSEAQARFMELIAADPTQPLAEHAVNALVALGVREGKLPTVASYLEGLQTGGKETPNTKLALTQVYMALKRPADAARQLDAAIESGTAGADAFLIRTQIYSLEGKTAEALAMVRRGIGIAPADVRLHLALAGLLELSQDISGALEAYEAALALNLDNKVAANNFAALVADYKFKDVAALDRGRQLAERFVASDNPLFLDTLGWVYYRQGKHQQAVNFLERAVAKGDVKPQIHYHLAAALAAINQAERAKEQLDLALAGTPDYLGVAEARELAKTLK